MRITHLHVLIIVIIIIGGGILGTTQIGLFDTSRSIQPSKLDESTNDYNVADIRGSFTLTEIEQYYQVPSGAIIEAFSLDKEISPTTFQLKDLKEIYQLVEIEGEMYEVETDTVKVFVSLYSGIPYVSEETTHLPKQAVEYLINEDKLTEEGQNYWINHTFDLLPIKQEITDTPVEEEADSDYQEIKPPTEEISNEPIRIVGKATIAEILAMGIDEETFQEITGLVIPEDRDINIRDYASSFGIDFGEIKGELETFLSN
jgi:hypothetical protein